MKMIMFISILISFLLTVYFLPRWIRKCRKAGLLWEDMNKFGHSKNVAASGGIVVVMAFVIAILSHVAIRVFVLNDDNGIVLKVFSLISVILILAVIGMTDDLLGWQHGGLSKRLRILLVIGASLPLAVINAGSHIINLPIFGVVDMGLLYPLIIIPLGITGATTTYNFLAGFNGLEAGQGIIILSFLSFVAYMTGSSWLALAGLCMVAALLGFYIYNKYPAKVFPGDIMTYSVGALIACMAIFGNFEKIAIFVFIPYILEVILKSRGRLIKHSFGIPDEKNNLKMPYDKIYGLTHLSIFIISKFKKEVKEKDVVYLIFCFQIIVCLLAGALFWGGIFRT